MANKPPQTIQQQIDLLKSRGMLFKNEANAPHFLANISYYRLKGYWWEMQSDKVQHLFHPDSYFEDALDLYNFDRHLRLLIFDAIERLEVALRTKLIYHLCVAYGPLWYLNHALFTDGISQMSIAGHLSLEISRSKEQFILEHKKNHKSDIPEAWKALEVASLGTLSKLYKNLMHQAPEKSQIAIEFGFYSHSEFSSFLEAITVIRNVIAHHSRLWNNNITTKFAWPKNFIVAPLNFTPSENHKAKLFPIFTLIMYALEQVSPGHSIRSSFITFINAYSNVPIYKMGFPTNWREQPVWK